MKIWILGMTMFLLLTACQNSGAGYGEEKSMPTNQKEISVAADHTERADGNGDTAKFWQNFKKPPAAVLREKLTPLQYKVTQQEGTEPPFQNEYEKNKRGGIYVDIVSGEPLFSSIDKYDSGTGWPSFTRPLVSDNIVTREDRSLFSVRTEVRSRYGGSHLGHVFNDGPPPTRLRYCMNSAALRFIAKEDLAREGYGEYRKLFEKK
ncbi:MAG: Peptide methionine sulfoxide reductase MsrB [Syntrophus sp. SKADARSKE-3]|nr:Peptide methionine sulfoxide reductase MsrB [Syntrophus sp. SKADARSKE-3]